MFHSLPPSSRGIPRGMFTSFLRIVHPGITWASDSILNSACWWWVCHCVPSYHILNNPNSKQQLENTHIFFTTFVVIKFCCYQYHIGSLLPSFWAICVIQGQGKLSYWTKNPRDQCPLWDKNLITIHCRKGVISPRRALICVLWSSQDFLKHFYN